MPVELLDTRQLVPHFWYDGVVRINRLGLAQPYFWHDGVVRINRLGLAQPYFWHDESVDSD